MSVFAMLAAMAMAGSQPSDDTGGITLRPAFGRGPAPKFVDGVIVRADWEIGPDVHVIHKFYPTRAHGVSGHVVLSCIAFIDHTVGSCYVESETPREMGFGEAAIHLTRTFRMRPETFNGWPRPSTVKVPIDFIGER